MMSLHERPSHSPKVAFGAPEEEKEIWLEDVEKDPVAETEKDPAAENQAASENAENGPETVEKRNPFRALMKSMKRRKRPILKR